MQDFLNHSKKVVFYSKYIEKLLKGFKQKRNIISDGNHSIASKLCLTVFSGIDYLKGWNKFQEEKLEQNKFELQKHMMYQDNSMREGMIDRLILKGILTAMGLIGIICLTIVVTHCILNKKKTADNKENGMKLLWTKSNLNKWNTLLWTEFFPS